MIAEGGCSLEPPEGWKLPTSNPVTIIGKEHGQDQEQVEMKGGLPRVPSFRFRQRIGPLDVRTCDRFDLEELSRYGSGARNLGDFEKLFDSLAFSDFGEDQLLSCGSGTIQKCFLLLQMMAEYQSVLKSHAQREQVSLVFLSFPSLPRESQALSADSTPSRFTGYLGLRGRGREFQPERERRGYHQALRNS